MAAQDTCCIGHDLDHWQACKLLVAGVNTTLADYCPWVGHELRPTRLLTLGPITTSEDSVRLSLLRSSRPPAAGVKTFVKSAFIKVMFVNYLFVKGGKSVQFRAVSLEKVFFWLGKSVQSRREKVFK